ncbi:MAG: class I SAM-dependent methyltransferase [Planctomycetota bacterium]|nr:class I SAM-dependent methyltransferase [Planctomycetota bacterium]
MSRRTIQLDTPIHEWLMTHSLRETPIQRELRDAMEGHPEGEMQTSPEQVQLLAVLLKTMRASRVIEVGVFTGYSALGMAMALPDDGVLVACDLDPDHMAVALEWWDRAGVSDRIQPRVGPAADSLAAMIEAGESGTYDFIYVDADKEGYPAYYELGLQLLRPGGLLTFDNMLRGGRVADPEVNDESTVATRELAAKLLTDDRVEYSLNPIGDGLAIAMLK